MVSATTNLCLWRRLSPFRQIFKTDAESHQRILFLICQPPFSRAAGEMTMLSRFPIAVAAALLIFGTSPIYGQAPCRSGGIGGDDGSAGARGFGGGATSGVGQMQETFVARTLTFDRNKYGSFNESETRRMAQTLIGFLS
jgi:hypothetical protein